MLHGFRTDADIRNGKTAIYARSLPLVAFGALCLMPAHAQQTVYNQVSSYPQIFAAWTIDVDQTGSGFITYDDFTLNDATSITSATWQAFSWDFVTPGNNPVPSTTTTQINLAFYADNSNIPGNLINAQDVTVTQTLVGTAIFRGDTVNVYNYAATLSSAVPLSANTKYWFSPLHVQTTFNPILVWMSATNTGGTNIQRQFSNGVPINEILHSGDRVFALQGFAAPEPGTLALLALALPAARLLRRPRRV